MIEMAVSQASVAAQIAADSIDVATLMQLKAGDENTSEYAGIAQSLRRAGETCGIMYVYTLWTDGSKVYYGVDADDTENKCDIGEGFSVSYEEMSGVFAGNSYVQDYNRLYRVRRAD